MKSYRIFLSSPTDVQIERDRADYVVRKLNAERIDYPQCELIRWENEHYGAAATFQDQIVRPSECHLVICIFWKRLGTELPESYRRTDGTIPTGTEYEFEDALTGAAASSQKLPDVFVYRKASKVQFALETLEIERAQYERFMGFWQRWFRNEKGHFLAAFQTFETTDDFESKFEASLRSWLSRRETNLVWTRGSPYRGLEPFDIEHAPIYFGRQREVDRARARLIASAMSGKPFLLIAGPSGSGKSSLVRAGLIPDLRQAGGLSTLGAVLRWVVVTPGQITHHWAEGLASELFEKDALGVELARGDFNTPLALAAQLERADRTAAAPLVRALQRAGEQAALAEGRDAAPKFILLIVIDQLEELFAWPTDNAIRCARPRGSRPTGLNNARCSGSEKFCRSRDN